MLDLGKIGYKIFMDDGQYRKSMQALLGESQKTASAVSGMFSKLAGLVGISTIFWKSATAAKALSREIANIRSIAGELDAGKLRTELMNLNAQLGDTAELANAVYYAYSAGVRGTEAELVKFTGQIAALAKTVGSGVTPIMDAVTTMMNAYGMKVQDAGKLTDWFYQIVKSGKTTGPELANALGQIASTAAGAGISLNELGAAIATLTTTMPTAVAITALGASIRAILNPTDDAQKMAAKLGIELGGAAIRAKGLQGVLNEIYQKTGGRSDLIGQLIPDARASKALTALSGTQNRTLNETIREFGANSGEAAKAFTEAISASDAAKWDAMLVVVKKLGTALGEITFQVLTLGGALNGIYEWIFSLNAASIQTIAKIGALTAGMLGLSKAVKLIRGGGASFLGLAIQGGYKTQDMLNAEATEAAEKKKALATEKSNADRMVSERRRHYLEMVNIARETQAAQEAANAKAAAARSNLANETINEANRYEQWTMTGTGTYTPSPLLGNAQRQSLDAERAANAASEAAKKAQMNVREAAAAYQQSRNAAAAANTAMQAHNAAVTTGTVKVGLLKGAWNGLKAAIAANPIGFAITAATMAISGLIYLIDRAKAEAEELMKQAEEAAERAQGKLQRGDETRDKTLGDIFRLDELSKMEKLSNGEMSEAEAIISRIRKQFKDFGAEVDRTTGKVKINAGSIQNWIAQARKARIEETKNVFEKNQKNQKTALKNLRGYYLSQFMYDDLEGNPLDTMLEKEQEILQMASNPEGVKKIIEDKSKKYSDKTKKAAKDLLKWMEKTQESEYEYTQAKNINGDDPLNKLRNDRLKKLEADSKGFTRRWDEELLTDEDRKARSYQRDFDNYKRIIDSRAALDKQYADGQYATDLQNARRRLSMLKNQNALESEIKNDLLEQQAEAYADGVLSDAEKLELKQAEIDGMDDLIAEWEKQLQQLPEGERRRGLEQKILEKRLARNRAAGELETMRDEQTYSAAEQKRQLELQERKNALGGNGPLTEANQAELKKLEIAQQTARIDELIERRAKAKTEEQRRQLSLQLAQAQSKRQEMNYELKSMREKQAADEAEYRRNLALLELQTKNQSDGEITYAERRSELALKMEQQRARIAELTKRAQEETNAMLKRQVELQLAQAKNQLGSLLVEQRNMQPQRQVMGSFSASVLARMSEPSSVDRQQLSELKKIQRNTKDNTLKYGK